MFETLKSIFTIRDLRTKIIATLLLILVYKFLSVIPIPGVNTEGLSAIIEQQKGLSFFSSLMWGGLSNFSIILMGLSPYINAVIILQLLGVIVPSIGELQKQGDAGQRKITTATRWLTLPIAFLQSYGMIVLLNSLAGGTIIDTANMGTVLVAMTIATAGTIFLMWLGEIMTEYGISNGISMIITAWVLAAVPGKIMTYLANTAQLPLFAGLFLATLAIIYVIIKFTEGHRRIPIIYAKSGMEEKSYFPIKVNQAGMIPIIFSISLITFPSIVGQILANTSGWKAKVVGEFLQAHFSMNNPTWTFISIFFLLVFAFSFFYVSVTFNTDDIAENVQKRGGYIPGIRPGNDTADYLQKVSNHLNVFGGWFLALIAILPYALGKILGQSVDLIISASGLIIITSVVLDVIRKIDAERKMFDYSKYK